MRYAKLINGSIYYAPNPILHNGLMRYNPPGSVYEAEGYKPVRYRADEVLDQLTAEDANRFESEPNETENDE